MFVGPDTQLIEGVHCLPPAVFPMYGSADAVYQIRLFPLAVQPVLTSLEVFGVMMNRTQ